MVTSGGSRERARRRATPGEAVPIVGERFCLASEERHLTVRKTSLFYPGDGFAVYEHHRRRPARDPEEERHRRGGSGTAPECEGTGELVFRVDSYGPAARDELILMGPDGDCILTVRRKWPSLHQRWEGFLGERTEGQKRLFSVRRYSIIGLSSGIGVEVCEGAASGHLHFRVEGSFPQRCCAVYEVGPGGVVVEEEEEEGEGKEDGGGGGGGGGVVAVADIRRKVVAGAADGVVLGKDVFCLRLAAGFDAAFAMGVVLALDRMTGDDGEEIAAGEGRDGDHSGHSGSPSVGR